MSSCQSTPDDPVKDPDFSVGESGCSATGDDQADKPGTLTLPDFLQLRGKLTHLAPELARSSSGSESEARKLTNFCRDLYELGKLQSPLIVTRNKLEYELMRDGKDRIEELSEVDMEGNLSGTLEYFY